MSDHFHPTKVLVEEFLGLANSFYPDINLEQILRARVYKIAKANVLIRAASKTTGNNRYFFGINYITVEEMANLDNPFIAFICGSVDNTLILPAHILFKNLTKISHDRNGEYKISLDKDLNIILKGRNNRLYCNEFVNSWNSLEQLYGETTNRSIEESLHSVLQGRLIEIGNIRGFRTFSPNKSKKFNGKHLSEITTLESCPELQFSDYNLLRQIDVLWFGEHGPKLIPEYAFEVEISTGTWSGVGRMATLMDYANTKLYVISQDKKKYSQVINAFPVIKDRYKHLSTDLIGDLYSAELQLKELRYQIGL
ncbi:MAG: hypothetical protein K9J16_11715 [Melioribacteraceae bacterium]|nr:hypothetical protein [Melioribacteraceae bacterium]MCF8354568.1 hypothetical protein [Melioribacteraceae bacterium]MCF8394500.1 hypothetical protein [Melioribacteraceae bacterium]MCF8420090.1 hypothetical protein [Melioribacteraceae bacterium]